MSQLTFGERVKKYLRAAGFSQKILANALGMDRTVLTHKLNSTGRTVLTYPEIKQIVKALAELGVITTRVEALELLAEVSCPDFTAEEWQAKPLKALENDTSSTFRTLAFAQPGLEKTMTTATATALTLSFLFTDIESSTALWEAYPQAMKLALARHDALLRKAIENHGGRIFKTVGDSFYATFSTATQAVEAALAAQRALKAEKWDKAIGQLRVRMALHSGTAEERDNDYFGQTLNRTARLLSAGHGGQILLSLVSAELVRDHLPQDVSLQELGEYRLKDLIRPERIFQLLVPDLPTEFPPLRTLETFPTNLPLQLTSFIGREQECVNVNKLLVANRLLTLTGAGGVGKTRLALQVGADLLDRFNDGVWLVELAPVSDARLVEQTVAFTLGIKEVAGQSLLSSLISYLSSKHLLLVLDNCEHLVQAAAELAEKLLQACPNLQILATSREALAIRGEASWRVPSLSVPSPQTAVSLERLTQYEAVRLFIERASLVKPDFAIANQTAPILAQICYQLDGIPLAIELAAVRMNLLSLEQLNTRLNDRFRLLTTGSRTVLSRQQTLRTLIDWSYNLLSKDEQSLLNRLAVFAGGWSLEAAEMVCAGNGIGAYEILDLLTQLLNKSLVNAVEQHQEIRYSMLETIRQYSRDKLIESGELELVREQHQSYFAQLVGRSVAELEGPEQAVWLERLEIEHDNFRAMLQGVVESKNIELALSLVTNLERFWNLTSYLSEGATFYRAILQALRDLPLSAANYRLQVDTILKMTQFSWSAVELEESIAVLKEGEKIMLNLSSSPQAIELDPLRLARLRYWLGRIYGYRNDMPKSLGYFQQVLPVAQKYGDEELLAIPSASLGRLMNARGQYAKALPLLSQAVIPLEKTGNWSDWILTMMSLGATLAFRGDYTIGISELNRTISKALELHHYGGAAMSYAALAQAYLIGGNLAEALKAAQAGLELAEQGEGQLILIFISQVSLLMVYNQLEDYELASKSLAQAEVIAQKLKGQIVLNDLLVSARAELSLKLGKLEEAIELAKEAITLAEASGGIVAKGIAYRIWGEALVAFDPPQWEEAENQMAFSLITFNEGEALLEAAHTELVWGELCRRQGKVEAAREHWMKAAKQFELSGLTTKLNKVTALLAELNQ